MHEASQHRYNSFVTLTLADQHLVDRYNTGRRNRKGEPIYSGTLTKWHYQKFIRRLRKALGRKSKLPIAHDLQHSSTRSHGATPHTPAKPNVRFYMAGEYGEQFARPHYHLCLFGIDFEDKYYWRTTAAGSQLFRSPALEKLWPYGHSTTGKLTFESAAYTARYVMKKMNGEKAEKHYEVIDHDTGEILRLRPEYNEMSRRQGIGKTWLEKYKSDVYDALPGKVIVRGKEANAPRYYNKQLEKWDQEKYELLLETRAKEARAQLGEGKPSRLAVREQVARAKTRSLKRDI